MTDREAAARDWLNRHSWRLDEIKGLELQLEEMRAAINKTVKPPKEVSVQTQPRNVQDEKISEIVDFEKRIQSKRDEYNLLQKTTIDTINRLDPSKRIILLYRYIYHRSWRYISGKLHYTESYCFELHVKALNSIYPLIDFSAK